MNEKADEFGGLPCGAVVGCRTVIDEAGVQFPNKSFFFSLFRRTRISLLNFEYYQIMVQGVSHQL